MSNKTKVLISVLIALLSIIIGVGIGSVFIDPISVLKVFLHKIFGVDLGDSFNDIYISLVWNVRLPRVLIAFVVGAMLAVSGSVIQSVLQNPLASSYSLGVSAGAGIGASIVIVSGAGVGGFLSYTLLPFTSTIFGIGTVILVVFIASKIDKSLANSTVVLLGMVIALFMNAILSTIAAMFSKYTEKITLWQMGSFSMKDWSPIYVILPVLIIVTLVFMKNTSEMDILTFGEEQALALGVDTKQKKWLLICLSATLTGVAVSFTGVIGFVDLIIAHIVRKIFGSAHKFVIPMSLLFGGSFIVICDLVARTVASPQEIPVGTVTAIIGAPFFVYIFLANRKKG